MVLSEAPGHPPTRLTQLLPGHPLLKQAGSGSSTPPSTLNQHLWSPEGAGSRCQSCPRCEHHQGDGPRTSRQPAAFQPGKEVARAVPRGRVASPSWGQEKSPRGDRSRSMPEADRAGRRGRELLEAARSTPRSSLCSVLSPRTGKTTFPPHSLHFRPFRCTLQRPRTGVFFHFLCFPNRLREGRLFPAWKTVRNSLPKCSEAAPAPSRHLGSSQRGGPLRGWLPAFPSWHPLRLPSSPLLGAWPTPANMAPCQRGAGCPSSSGRRVLLSQGGERRGQDRGRPRRYRRKQGQEGGGGAGENDGHGQWRAVGSDSTWAHRTEPRTHPRGLYASGNQTSSDCTRSGAAGSGSIHTVRGRAEQGQGLGVPSAYDGPDGLAKKVALGKDVKGAREAGGRRPGQREQRV